MVEQRLSEIDWPGLSQRSFYPSPAAWEDQVMYFLMLDRFSDGREDGYLDLAGHRMAGGSTPLFQPNDAGLAIQTPGDRQKWFEAGGRFVGGTLKGLSSKLGYLKRLGVTALWISPVFKQVTYIATYHGYGIQNFLDIDPHFGTREDLRHLVQLAHTQGIYVILDIILNHSGDVFAYQPDRYDCHPEAGRIICDPRWDGRPYTVAGYRDAVGEANLPFGLVDQRVYPQAWPEAALWPEEFQAPETFSCMGRINNWEHYPEYLEGDFCSLKDIHLGQGLVDQYQPSPALRYLSDVYKFWLAYADLDGYRVDTVKHMDLGASRYFTSVIHEFAQSLGKENFYLIGEITGGRIRAFDTLEQTGLDAALGIDDIPDKLEYLVKGYRNPQDYFDLFRNSLLVRKESHVWFRNRVVTTFDDHDQVRKGKGKARFCYDEVPGQQNQRVAFNALALMVTTLGIPCIYYGTEQGFDGHGDNDRYIREAMFGGEFGAFASKGRHFFNEAHPLYQQLSQLLALRKKYMALRRGRQYLRPISGDGLHFGLPQIWGSEIRSVVPWSRIFNDQEILLALNTDYFQPQTAWVTIDNDLHVEGDQWKCIFSTLDTLVGQEVQVAARNGKALHLTVPAAGFVIYNKI